MGRTAYTEPQCLYRGVLYLYLYIMTLYLCVQKRASEFVAVDSSLCDETLRASGILQSVWW